MFIHYPLELLRYNSLPLLRILVILPFVHDDLEIDAELLKNPFFQRVLADSLSIQNRFSAEPVYAITGKGYLKSAGTEELQNAKASRTQDSHGAGK